MVVVSSAFSAPATGILYQTPDTKLIINDQELGTATLYITEQNVVWGGGVMPSGAAAPTITLAYPNITLHAVQKDPSSALYMVLSYELRVPQLQGAGPAGDEAANEDDDEDFDGDDSPITQLRFIPPNDNDLPQLFEAMNQGQQMHPDPEDDDYMDGEDVEAEEGDSDSFEDAEESDPTAAAARMRDLRIDQSNGTTHDDADEPIDE